MQSQTIDMEYERYKDWDMSDSKPANLHPMVKKLQDNVRLAQMTDSQSHLLDEDVTEWLTRQNTDTKRHVSEMIRHAIALQGANFA